MSTNSNKRKQTLWRAALAAGFVLELGFILVALFALISGKQDIPAWQQIAFVAILVWIYIAYLKQRSLDISAHVVDEKIKTHSLVESLDDGLLLVSPENELLIMNSNAASLTGLSEIEALGKNLAERVDTRVQTMLSSRQAGEIEGPFVPKGHPLHIRIKLIESHAGGEPYKLIRVTESSTPAAVTAEGVSREELKALRQVFQSLEQSDSAKDKARRILQGRLSLLMLEAQPLMNAIQARSLSKQVQRSSFNLIQSVKDAAADLRTGLEQAGLSIQAEAPYETLKVSADPEKVRLLLDILVLKAALASPEGSTVIVKFAELGENAGVSVLDASAGLPADQLPGLFDQGPYALARGLVEAQGGSIWADCPPGKGINMITMLPAG
jgi:signal transduction histidine kinase